MPIAIAAARTDSDGRLRLGRLDLDGVVNAAGELHPVAWDDGVMVLAGATLEESGRLPTVRCVGGSRLALPQLIVDHLAADEQPIVAVVVEDRLWLFGATQAARRLLGGED